MEIEDVDVQRLLEEIVKELPNRRNAAFIGAGLRPTFQCLTTPPEALTRVATFDRKVVNNAGQVIWSLVKKGT